MKKEMSIVTGGSSGLGLEIAKLYVKNGQNICIVAQKKDKLEKAHNILSEINQNVSILAIQANVSDEDSVSKIFERIKSEAYSISSVYNCAGIGLFGEASNVTKSMVESLLEANFIGLILFSTKAINYMKDNGGTIINIMSSAAKKGNPLESVYCGVKWGARGYTEALSAAMKGSNIRILAVYPGGMNTPFWTPTCGLSPDTSKFMAPEEVADSIYSAVIERASMKITELSIDRK